MKTRMSGDDHTLPMTVKNTGFLLDRLGQDCHPLQFLRELTQNSIEAIQRTGKSGEIIWDVDWTTFELENVMKLCVIDNGAGMSGPEMVEHINKLSSSGSEQSFSGNYGVGAKIAAATRNHEGMVYLSWKNGQGSMIHLWRNRNDGTYGLKQQRREDDSYSDYLDLDDAIKPAPIGSHGTKIVLYGNALEENTIEPPNGVLSASRWIAKYLNSRYFRFPKGITIKAREGWQYQRSDRDRNLLRKLIGQEKYLDEHHEAKGKVQVEGAVVHWWILKDETALGQNSGYIESSGHVGALYQDELYEMSTGRSGTARLQHFGIIFGMRQVVLYVEPQPDQKNKLTTNTSRTILLLNNETLPWADWATEFREKMPKALEEFIAQKAAGASSTDHSKSVRERLKAILDLYKVSRYRPTPSGELLVDDEAVVGGQPASSAGQTSGKSASPGGKRGGGTLGNIYTLFEKKDGVPGERVQPDPFPRTQWISSRDGTRELHDLEDRAAKFISDQNLLLINADFRVFTDMTIKFVKEFGGNEAIRATVDDVVKTWFEQALVETVIGIRALQGAKEWPLQKINEALSEEALSASVMQRYHVNNSIKRELGAKLGRIQSA
jgi:hypothetical protein